LEIPEDTVPLVLLHAFPLSSKMWGPMLEYLPELPVLTIDLPGAGMSPTVDPIEIRGAGLAVAESLRELGVRQAVVGGCSMGGYVTMSMMKDSPDLLAGVMLVTTKAVADTPEVRENRLRIAREALDTSSAEPVMSLASTMVSEQSKKADPHLVERLSQWIAESTPDGIAWAEEAMALRPDYTETLRASGIPSLVVAGGEDPFSPAEYAEAMVEALGPNSDLVVVSGVAHLPAVEAPQLAARMTRETYHRIVD
jgi:pimeloyl-ACP methyl ester carboxylesterase